jgi:hypothetical protein
MFAPDYVQTCQGIFGHFGKHPSSVNDSIVVRLYLPEESLAEKMVAAARDGVSKYCADYGDKTQPGPSGQPAVVDSHYELVKLSELVPGGYELRVHGKAGHMGAIKECDDAIVKAAYVLRKVLEDIPGTTMKLVKGDRSVNPRSISLEGGQGFIPVHPIADLMPRIRSTVDGAVHSYCSQKGARCRQSIATVSFDKLHNDAYAIDPDSSVMRAMDEAYIDQGMDIPERTAWRVSCDARIFAHEGYRPIVFGPGSLKDAHQGHEHIRLAEVEQALVTSTLFILNQCGYSISPQEN